MKIMVLNDGKTYTPLDGCFIAEVPIGSSPEQIKTLLQDASVNLVQLFRITEDGAVLNLFHANSISSDKTITDHLYELSLDTSNYEEETGSTEYLGWACRFGLIRGEDDPLEKILPEGCVGAILHVDSLGFKDSTLYYSGVDLESEWADEYHRLEVPNEDEDEDEDEDAPPC